MPAICGLTRNFAGMARSYGAGAFRGHGAGRPRRTYRLPKRPVGCAVRTNSPLSALLQTAKKKLPQEHEGEWLIGRKGVSGQTGPRTSRRGAMVKPRASA
jgi:hypothetical protein